MLTIADDTGKQVRRLDLRRTGVHRIAWNLRGEPPAAWPRQGAWCGAAAGAGGAGAAGAGEASEAEA